MWKEGINSKWIHDLNHVEPVCQSIAQAGLSQNIMVKNFLLSYSFFITSQRDSFMTIPRMLFLSN